MNLLYIILCIIALSITFQLLHYSKVGVNLYDFSVQRTLPLRGLLAILIITHHLSQVVWALEIPIIHEFMSWGGVVVGVFFFITGYGLMITYIKKGNEYLNGFLKHRLGKLLPPIIIATLCYLTILSFLTQSNAFLLIADLRYGTAPLPTSWFVYAVIFFYLAFYCAAKILLDQRFLIICLWIISTIYIIVLHSLGWEDCWYKSIFAFNIGSSFAYFEHKIKQYIIQNPKSCIFIIVSLLVFLFFVRYINTYILVSNTPIWKSAVYYSVPLFCVAVIYLFKGFPSPGLRFLGRISYEIYLVQGAFVTLLSPMRENWIAYFILVYILSIITAWMLHRLCNSILK